MTLHTNTHTHQPYLYQYRKKMSCKRKPCRKFGIFFLNESNWKCFILMLLWVFFLYTTLRNGQEDGGKNWMNYSWTNTLSFSCQSIFILLFFVHFRNKIKLDFKLTYVFFSFFPLSFNQISPLLILMAAVIYIYFKKLISCPPPIMKVLSHGILTVLHPSTG